MSLFDAILDVEYPSVIVNNSDKLLFKHFGNTLRIIQISFYKCDMQDRVTINCFETSLSLKSFI